MFRTILVLCSRLQAAKWAAPPRGYQTSPRQLVCELVDVSPEVGWDRFEPLLSGTGLGNATEARGFMSKRMLANMLGQALDDIRRHVGPQKAPIGYLPWEDAGPYYRTNSAMPQFDVAQEVGLEYCVTTQDQGQAPHIVYQDGDFRPARTRTYGKGDRSS